MARPQYDAQTRPADERLIGAFWETLAEKPLREMSVAELCRRAGCNKTTFYYHFRDLEELVRRAEAAFEEEDFPGLLVDIVLSGDQDESKEALVERLRPQVDRARLLLGPGGDPSFAGRMQRAMLARWCERLGVRPDEMEPYDALLLRHAMGGTSSVLADTGSETDYALLLRVIVDTAAPHIDRMMAKYAPPARLMTPAQGRPQAAAPC